MICEIKAGELLFMAYPTKYGWDHHWLIDNFRFLAPVINLAGWYLDGERIDSYQKEFDRHDWESWCRFLYAGQVISYLAPQINRIGKIVVYDRALYVVVVEDVDLGSIRVPITRVLSVDGLKFRD